MKTAWIAATLAASGLVSAQVAPPANLLARVPAQNFGAPLSGLTSTELALFNEGRIAFTEVESPQTGLGPIFNGRSCIECHGGPAPGGSSPIVVTRFGRTIAGVFDPLTAKGGPLLQRFAIDPAAIERIPPEANVVAQRQSTPLYGLGLIEAIPDEAILAQANAAKPDGVRGRAAIVVDAVTQQPRVGRFGWKAQHATLLAFAADAYLNEMGITNRFFPAENAPNGDAALLARFDRLPDPEDIADATGRSDIDSVANFMRLLAPPPRIGTLAQARTGEALFAQVGCSACHVPAMTTGPSDVAALAGRSVGLHSDLLLHDMGALNDGIAQAAAGANEIKTPPLWGLRASAPYLHDGRAPTIDAAIRAHDGEGRAARDRYEALAPALRQQIIDFLNTL